MSLSQAGVYLPAPAQDLSHDDIWRWLENVLTELASLELNVEESSSFREYYREAGLLTTWKRSFFRHHYATPLLTAVRALFEGNDPPRILDLGAGTGTQTLLFALLGAHVTAVDLDGVALSVLAKRKKYYEERTGRPLAVVTRECDVFRTDWAKLGPFTGVYSLFAFNMMQPSQDLLARLSPHLSSTAVVAIQDGNRSHFFNRLFRRRTVLGKSELAATLRRLGFADVRHLGGYAIPPPVWCLVPYGVLAPVDRVLATVDALAVSFLHVARRGR